MATITRKSVATPDETRSSDKTTVEVVDLGATKAKVTLQPRGRWSDSVRPAVGGDIGPGDAYVMEPGHDAWVTSGDTWIGLGFERVTAETHAKPS